MPKKPFESLLIVGIVISLSSSGVHPQTIEKPKIAVFAGGLATVLNSPTLITSNKARALRGLPLLTHPDGSPARFDPLVPQRLAAPVEVYIEQFSAHPLESDVAELYAPPDGYLDVGGAFHEKRQSPQDKPVYKVTLRPEDGLYPLPYMALQVNGQPWDGACTSAAGPQGCRQAYFPDPSRLFEEIDRGIGGRTRAGTVNMLASKASYDFYRALPSSGYTKGLPAAKRTDVGTGDIPPEVEGEDWFPAGDQAHLRVPRMKDLAKLTNVVQKALSSGSYDGALWLEDSHGVHDTSYWLNLLIDTRMPFAATSSMSPHGSISNDGDLNAVDCVDYLISKVWADAEGRDDLGVVLVEHKQLFTARQVEKISGRPGGYQVPGDAGVLGSAGVVPNLWSRPVKLHTWKSAVNMSRLPSSVQGVRKSKGEINLVEVRIKDDLGMLLEEAIPTVTMARYNRYFKTGASGDPQEEVEVLARIEKNLQERPLGGFVMEALVGNAVVHESLGNALQIAVFSGMPVVKVSRDASATLVPENRSDYMIEGDTLTAPKARLLLMAAMMKLGVLPPAKDPLNPTAEEKKRTQERIALYQEIFNTH